MNGRLGGSHGAETRELPMLLNCVRQALEKIARGGNVGGGFLDLSVAGRNHQCKGGWEGREPSLLETKGEGRGGWEASWGCLCFVPVGRARAWPMRLRLRGVHSVSCPSK